MHLYPLSGTRVTRFVCSLNDLKHFTILVVNPKWQQAFGIGIDLLFFKVMTIYNALYALLLVRGIHNFVEHNQMFPCHGPKLCCQTKGGGCQAGCCRVLHGSSGSGHKRQLRIWNRIMRAGHHIVVHGGGGEQAQHRLELLLRVLHTTRPPPRWCWWSC